MIQSDSAARHKYDNWLSTARKQLIPPVDFGKRKATPVRLDLDHLVPDPETGELSMRRLGNDLAKQCLRKTAQIGYGGYLEERKVYSAPSYRAVENGRERWRSLHLGLDIWTFGWGLPVRAPLAGRVHSFQDNDGYRDYGPTIILEHEPQSDLVFYTLYGHLTRESIDLSVGQLIEAGEDFAVIGRQTENGGWSPHLHFQVILDLGGRTGDFPGVGYADERDQWAKVCPDPYPFFRLRRPKFT